MSGEYSLGCFRFSVLEPEEVWPHPTYIGMDRHMVRDRWAQLDCIDSGGNRVTLPDHKVLVAQTLYWLTESILQTLNTGTGTGHARLSSDCGYDIEFTRAGDTLSATIDEVGPCQTMPVLPSLNACIHALKSEMANAFANGRIVDPPLGARPGSRPVYLTLGMVVDL